MVNNSSIRIDYKYKSSNCGSVMQPNPKWFAWLLRVYARTAWRGSSHWHGPWRICKHNHQYDTNIYAPNETDNRATPYQFGTLKWIVLINKIFARIGALIVSSRARCSRWTCGSNQPTIVEAIAYGIFNSRYFFSPNVNSFETRW